MTTGGPGGYSSDINVTPMIDILLVLLIIFMVIVPVTPKGLDALVPQPPKDPTKQPPQTDRTIVVQVLYRPGNTPVYKINETDYAKADLLPRLTEIYANRAERVMFVKGDRHWPRGERGSHRLDDAQDPGRPVT
jgi:biopolymer transport protein ExbD